MFYHHNTEYESNSSSFNLIFPEQQSYKKGNRFYPSYVLSPYRDIKSKSNFCYHWSSAKEDREKATGQVGQSYTVLYQGKVVEE